MEKVCEKCDNTFNNTTPCNTWVDIRGRRFCWECKPYNTGNRKALSESEFKVCPRCTLELPIEQFYIKANTGKRRTVTYCKICLPLYNKERELKVKIELILLKGGCCYLCGYKKNVYALDFHHRDPSKKEFNLAHTSGITQKVLDEIEKCDLVCSNCHREIHHLDKNNLL